MNRITALLTALLATTTITITTAPGASATHAGTAPVPRVNVANYHGPAPTTICELTLPHRPGKHRGHRAHHHRPLHGHPAVWVCYRRAY